MKTKIKQILTGTFWLVMAIHLVVFTAIGLISGRWRLILIFLPFLTLAIIIKYITHRLKR